MMKGAVGNAITKKESEVVQMQAAPTFTLNISPEKAFPSLATFNPHVGLEQQLMDFQVFKERKEYEDPRKSLLTDEFIPDKYPDMGLLEEIRKKEALASHGHYESDIQLIFKQQLFKEVPKQYESSALLNDPTVGPGPDRTTFEQHQRKLQQIITEAAGSSDVEMVDESATMEAKYPEGQGNKKKKRKKNKNKKKKTKDTAAGEPKEAEETKAQPIEIEMIELKPKTADEIVEESGEKARTPTKKEDRIYFNKELEGALSKPHSQKGGSVHNISTSPIYKSLIGTPSTVKRAFEGCRRVEDGIEEQLNEAQRLVYNAEDEEVKVFIDGRISSLIMTTIEEQEELAEEAPKVVEISEVTEVIDLKK